MNPATEDFPYSDRPELNWNYGLINKLGNHYVNDSFMNWYIYGNYDNALKLYTGSTPENLENVVVKDTLSDDLIVDAIKINTPINHPKNETQLSDKSAFKLNITEQFKNVNEDTVVNGRSFANQEEWEAYINATPLTYGTSKDKKVALVNLGNLPGDLKMADSAEELKAKFKKDYIHFSEAELDALADIYKVDESNPYPVYAFQIHLKVKSSNENEIFSKTSYDNTAYLTSTNGPSDDDKYTLNVTQVGAGIQGNETKTAILTKTDADTGEVIPGASFKLQYLNGSSWEDYVTDNDSSIEITDSNGQIKYTNLGSGTYRFVEVAAATGYDIESVEYSQSEFVITSSGSNIYSILATNEKLPETTVKETTTMEETTTTEETTTEETTTEETTTEETTTEETTTEETTTEETSTEETTTKETTTKETTTEETTTEETTTEETTTEETSDVAEELIPDMTVPAAGIKPSVEPSTEPTTSEEATTSEEVTTVEEATTEEEATTSEEVTTVEETTTAQETTDTEEELIPDMKVPAAGNTGDTSNSYMWIILLAVSAVIIPTVFLSNKKIRLNK